MRIQINIKEDHFSVVSQTVPLSVLREIEKRKKKDSNQIILVWLKYFPLPCKLPPIHQIAQVKK